MFLEYLSARYCLSGGKPSVVLYCRTLSPLSSNTLMVASPISLTGKSLGFGSPPAKEITWGSSVTLRISLINDFWTLAILLANEPFICIPCFLSTVVKI